MILCLVAVNCCLVENCSSIFTLCSVPVCPHAAPFFLCSSFFFTFPLFSLLFHSSPQPLLTTLFHFIQLLLTLILLNCAPLFTTLFNALPSFSIPSSPCISQTFIKSADLQINLEAKSNPGGQNCLI